MSSAAHPFATPSQDFITLCQSQIKLLTQGLKADWSAVYLTNGHPQSPLSYGGVRVTQESQERPQTRLIPIVFYPPQEDLETRETTKPILSTPDSFFEDSFNFPLSKFPELPQSLGISGQLERTTEDEYKTRPTNPYQLVLPLIHKEIMVGFLVTGRKDRQWQQTELEQIETIAQTLAIARLLDSCPQWYQEKLHQQQQLQRQERDRLDDLFHQLRNPLTALRIFGKLLLKRLRSDEKSLAIVENILRESDHLQELLQNFENSQSEGSIDEDIITFNTQARRALPAGKPLPLSAIRVTEILEPIIISAQSVAQEKEIDLTRDISQEVPLIWGNAPALREVFSNLIDNALKYTPSGGKVWVTVGVVSQKGEKMYQGIAVEDTGYGIPFDDQDHIFERHYRGVQETGSISGSGLGLAIAKDLVTQMQGKIELISPTNEQQKIGTRFVVWLPLVN